MDDYAVQTKPSTVRMERLLPGPIEKVWAYLTESEKRGSWLAFGNMDLRVGGKVHLEFNHDHSPVKEEVPEKYKDVCETGATMEGTILKVDAPHLLSYTWSEGDGAASEVTFELREAGEKVHMTLTHEKLPNRQILIGVSAGWHAHIAIMIDQLEGKTPRPFWSTHMELETEYDKRMPAA
tara:strand:+ start:274 stop:813 length:540 start_codon:yes stop_codon:yes gene_type:complete